jgi:hypothetical protein
MADDRYDQLYQIRQQAAHQRYVQGLQNQAQANLHDYQQAIAENDMNAAAFAESEYRKNTRELAEMTGGQAAQQQQQQAPQQQPQQQEQQSQQQLTGAERDLLRDYPQIANDPAKWRTALAAANNLILRGYDRNSGEYVAAIAHACGVLNSDLTESNEVASPNEALRASQSKYGEVTASEYNENARRLAELKKYGFYPMDNK